MRAAWLALVGWLPLSGLAGGEIAVLTYHDIVAQRGGDAYAVTRDDLRSHLAYLKREGYTPVSLAQIERAGRGGAALPAKPVVLSFDDGLKSYASEAVPLLRDYGYPSVLSIVTSWIDGARAPAEYRGRFLSWEELRALDASPLIEIVSHSHDLHRALRANPQGNEAPAAVTREYRVPGGYESEDDVRARLRADLARTRARFEAELRRPPRAITWPYGAYDQLAVEEAARLGMRLHLTLDERPATLNDLPRVNRMIVYKYRRLADLDDMLRFRAYRNTQLRFVQIDLEAWAGKSGEAQEELLSALVQRLQLLGVNALLVDPLTRDRRGAFFPTDALPVRSEVLNRVLHQVQTRARVAHLYLRLPARIEGADILRVYSDLARLHRFNGVVFEGKGEAPVLARAVERLRYHQPTLQVGVVAGDGSEDLAADFVLSEIALPEQAERVSALAGARLAGGRTTLFLLRRAAGGDDQVLRDAMRALRSAGAAHYGYSNDDFTGNVPDVLRVVRELRAHTVVRDDRAQGGR